VQALTEVHSNKDGSNKVTTKPSSTSWKNFFARQGIDDATGELVAITLIMMLHDSLIPFFRMGSDPDLIKLAQAGHNLLLTPFLMAADNAKTIHYNINVAFLNSMIE